MPQKGPNEKFCAECGEAINAKAEICPKCGVRQAPVLGQVSGIPNQRRCLSCGHQGKMQTWLRNYSLPQFVALIGLLIYVLPGLAFIAWAWGKYKCPSCGKVGESVAA